MMVKDEETIMFKVLVMAALPEDRKYYFEGIEGMEFIFDSNKNNCLKYKDADIIIGNPPLDVIDQFANLKWIQLNSAGANTYSGIKEDIILTNASGAYGLAISEYMIAAVMMIQKRFPEYQALQKQHVYRNIGMVGSLYGSTVLSVGMGDIGSNFARRMKAMGCHVIGIRRTVHDQPEYVDELYDYSRLDEILPRADIIGLSLPETRETIGMFDLTRLSLCKKGSILVNVGRGSAIVTDDLITVCRQGQFTGVALDVYEQEPLPEDSPLWDTPGVYMTPHVSGGFRNAQITVDYVLTIIRNNLLHYAAGEKLDNIVDKSIGY